MCYIYIRTKHLKTYGIACISKTPTMNSNSISKKKSTEKKALVLNSHYELREPKSKIN